MTLFYHELLSPENYILWCAFILESISPFIARMEPCISRGGGWDPPKFFKILNNRYIFKILENKSMKNYICPLKKIIFAPLDFES